MSYLLAILACIILFVCVLRQQENNMENTRRVIQATATVIVHPMDDESDDEAINRFFGENNPRDFFDITDTWEEPE